MRISIKDIRRWEGARGETNWKDIYLRLPQILPTLEVHDEHVRGLHELLLHAARRNVDFVFVPDARSASGSCHLD